ncbi:hypothetical protein COE61_22760 [Bacillus thuringiensis]|nr:hypothetical protein [Bacillus thuringiensis]PDX91824.1 hypothetical protein COM78_26820 [Bacillus thuringiensis]PGZ73522.1 hypothetical protein COE61_22760 [Bacillus thuringiensis]
MAKNNFNTKVDVDTQEVLQQMKEVNKVPSFVAVLGNMGEFTDNLSIRSDTNGLAPTNVALDNKVIKSDVIKRINNSEERIYI